jgi:peptidoglycan/LPS O-acetylase OafA/YrhL
MANHRTNPMPFSNETVAGKYYSGLDGLRGIAIILVVGYHYFPSLSVFGNAWLGVDLFFVLSGFLITEILLRTNNTENQLRNFYIRRILRIFPVYYFSLFLYFFVLPGLGSTPLAESYYVSNKAWFLLYLQNWLFIFKTPDPSTFLNHYWSLGVEEQFYIIWPVLIVLIRNTKKLSRILLGGLILVASTRIVLFLFPVPKLNYYNFHTFSRIDGLLAGSIRPPVIKRNISIGEHRFPFSFPLFSVCRLYNIFYCFCLACLFNHYQERPDIFF